jgi:hypothetical protein
MALTMARTICMNAERSLQGQKKEKFPSHRWYYRGKKIFQLVFLVGPPGGSSRVKVVVRAASECKSERKTNDVKSAKKNQQLMIGF